MCKLILALWYASTLLENKFSDDVKAIVGKATYPSILEKANASEADMIIAVTRNDEINMVICQIAFSIFKSCSLYYLFSNQIFDQLIFDENL